MSSVSVGTGRQGYDETSDRALIAMTRDGDAGAYSELWIRHRLAAVGAARLASRSIDADDLVSEAYTVILAALRDGRGPVGDGFRPYLCATVRNLARRWGGRRRELAVEELPEDPRHDAVLDAQLGSLDERLVREAFGGLPRRWQEVLWHTEVEGVGVAELARHLGLRPGAAAALAFRAREGLRKAWLQAHVADTLRTGECGWVLERIGEHSRDSLRKRAAARVDAHLASCRSCRDVALEVGQVSRHLARILLPLLAGGGGALGWLAAPAAPVAASAIGVAVAAAAITAAAGFGVVVQGPPAPLGPIERVESSDAHVAPVWTPRIAPDPALPVVDGPAGTAVASSAALGRAALPVVADVVDEVRAPVPELLPEIELEIELDRGGADVRIAADVPIVGDLSAGLGVGPDRLLHLDLGLPSELLR